MEIVMKSDDSCTAMQEYTNSRNSTELTPKTGEGHPANATPGKDPHKALSVPVLRPPASDQKELPITHPVHWG